MSEGPSSVAASVVLLAILGVSAVTYAVVVSSAAFLIALYLLVRFNGIVTELHDIASQQAAEISELADPHREVGDGET